VPQVDDLSRSLTAFDQDSTLIAVIEMSLKNWLVAGIVPGVGRAPLKKLEADEAGVLRLLHRWRDEATKAGRHVTLLVVAFEAGRDGFWLARWLRTRAVSRPTSFTRPASQCRGNIGGRRRTGWTEMLKRAFLGWLRGEAEHCQIAAVPTLAEEDAGVRTANSFSHRRTRRSPRSSR
jgi:transposase